MGCINHKDREYGSQYKSHLDSLLSITAKIRREKDSKNFVFSRKSILPSPRDRELECPSCSFQYNGQLEKPLLLPCGHTICEKCVYKKPQETLKCPIDLKSFQKKEFPVVESLIKLTENSSKAAYCKVHGKEIKGICQTSKNLVCEECPGYLSSTNVHVFLGNIKKETTEYISSLKEELRKIQDFKETTLSLEHDLGLMIHNHKQEIIKHYSQTTANYQKRFEEYAQFAENCKFELERLSLSNAIESGISVIDNEIVRATESKKFEDLNLSEQIEIVTPGPVVNKGCPKIDYSHLIHLKQNLKI